MQQKIKSIVDRESLAWKLLQISENAVDDIIIKDCRRLHILVNKDENKGNIQASDDQIYELSD